VTDAQARLEHPPFGFYFTVVASGLFFIRGVHMGWFPRKSGKKTYYCVGWTVRDSEVGVFRNVALPGGGVMRLMDKGVYQAALESAAQKLRELGRRSGKKEPAL
jgi:hypothetical protein